MQIKKIVLYASFLLSVQLNAQTLLIAKGWQMLGAQVDITDINATFTNNIVYAYQNGAWSALNSNEDDVLELKKIDAGEGFWINGTDSTSIELTGSDTTSSAIDVTSGWQIKAATSQLCSSQIFSSDSVVSVYRYENGNWKVYEPNSTSSEFELLTTLDQGNGFWINSSKNQTLTPTLTINGSIVDGYIKDAKISIASLSTGNSISILDSSSLSTDNGAFSISIANITSADTGFIITATSGTDEGTGETYEGILKTVVANESCDSSNEVNQNITPITTLVAENVTEAQNTRSKSRSNDSLQDLIIQAQERVAESIGISVAFINSDPQELLRTSENNNTRAAATKILKTSLAIQKTAEMMASSIVDKNDSDAFNSVVSSTFKAFATSIAKSTTKSDFETLLADTDTLITKTVENINQELSENAEFKETIQDAQEKLDASKDIIANSTDMMLQMKEDEFITDIDGDIQLQIDTVQKSLELVTRKIEEKAQNIAKAKENFANHTQDAKDMMKTIAVGGGIDGAKSLMTKEMARLGADGKTINTEKFANNLFSDARMNEKKQEFDRLFGEEFNRDIMSAAVQSYEEIIKQQIDGELVDDAFIAQKIQENIDQLPQDKQEIINQNIAQYSETMVTDIQNFITVGNNFMAESKEDLIFKRPADTVVATRPIDNFENITSFTSNLLMDKTFFVVFKENSENSEYFGLWVTKEMHFNMNQIISKGLTDIKFREEQLYTLANGNLELNKDGTKSAIIKIISSQPDYIVAEFEDLASNKKEEIFLFANKDLALDFMRQNNKITISNPLPAFSQDTKLSTQLLSGRTFYDTFLEINNQDSAFNLRWVAEEIRFTDAHIISNSLFGADASSTSPYEIIDDALVIYDTIDADTPLQVSSSTKIVEIKPDYLLLEHSSIGNAKEISRMYLSKDKAIAYADTQNRQALASSKLDFGLSVVFEGIENRRLFMVSQVNDGRFVFAGDFYLNSQTKETSNGATYEIDADGVLTITSQTGTQTSMVITDALPEYIAITINDNLSAFLFKDRFAADEFLKQLNKAPIQSFNVINGIYTGTLTDTECEAFDISHPLEIIIDSNSISMNAETTNFTISSSSGRITDINQELATISFISNTGIEFASGIINKQEHTIFGSWQLELSRLNKTCGGLITASTN